ncbi:MAG: mobA [Clostridia bacterium]|jgi:molybdopterin-guanine dinucleotide biosynthesis protein A|nr:mobA [Clostridia bacterium]
MMPSGTAVIMAGGKSSRMGFDKQSIKLQGKLLIEQQIQVLQSIFNEIIIVTNRPELYQSFHCIMVTDELKDFGPLGGIHIGLKASSSQFSYFLACDMPNINREYILHMQKIIHDHGKDQQAVITRFGNWLEPFHAFYSKSLIPVIEQAYQERNNKVGSMLEKVKVHYIEEEEARCFSPDWSMFANINTQDDLIKLK